jgi:hypothetical protein
LPYKLCGVGAFDYILSYASTKECGKEGQRKVLTTQLQQAISKYKEEQQTSKQFKENGATSQSRFKNTIEVRMQAGKSSNRRKQNKKRGVNFEKN